MPETKRNEALIKIATNVLKKYAPEYERGLKVIVTDRYQTLTESHYNACNKATHPEAKWQCKWALKAHTGAKWYAVDFIVDSSKERITTFTDVAASIFIWADTGKAFRAVFSGPGGRGLYNLDEMPDQKSDFHYKACKPFKPISVDTVYYDSQGNEIRRSKVVDANANE